ncbi:MAG: hypothetical protein JXA54_12890 [Candidatus Heimdallarchaeota archaeon]|nr:hypothetical protein [Candidatus Heimdallarchaeota archaeon]
MISGIYVINSAGLKLYSRTYDSKIVIDDVLLMSFLTAIQIYAESAIDESIQSIESEGLHIIYRLPDKQTRGGVMIVIVAQFINSTILLKAGHIIDLLRKELIDCNDFESTILNIDKYTKEIQSVEVKIDRIINLSEAELEMLNLDEHVIRLEKILNNLSKRIPLKSLQIDPHIYVTDKKTLKVDPSITLELSNILVDKLRASISRLFGSKTFDEALK